MRRLGLLLALAVPVAAVDEAARGWDHFYNLEYAEAIRVFEKAIASDPDDPAGHNHLAQAILYKELYRLGALESELLTGNNHFIRTEKLRPDPREAERFMAAIDKAIQLAQERLDVNPQDTEALYALGSSYALRTNYHFLVQKSWSKAVGDGSKARELHNKVVALDPDNYDAMLTQGAYDYVIGSLPWHTRLFSFLVGRRGNKQRGIRTIELVAEKGERNRVDAQVLLAIIYRREKQPAKAIQVLEPLIKEWPRNYLFRMEKAHMLSDLGRKEESLAVLRELETLALSGRPEYAKIPLEKVYYAIGNVQFWYNDLDEALDNLRRVTRSPELDLHTGVLAWMRLGQIYDLKSRRREAIAAYREAIRHGPQTAAAEESKRYLSSPYKRKG